MSLPIIWPNFLVNLEPNHKFNLPPSCNIYNSIFVIVKTMKNTCMMYTIYPQRSRWCLIRKSTMAKFGHPRKLFSSVWAKDTSWIELFKAIERCVLKLNKINMFRRNFSVHLSTVGLGEELCRCVVYILESVSRRVGTNLATRSPVARSLFLEHNAIILGFRNFAFYPVSSRVFYGPDI